ncbi:MAG: hemolysin family protein [Firmicutes bacterium]|jgi:CBS domain containing-hemolysin-like protein|nr:hemolysin family protein [Bacillota bacterium]
MKFRKHSKSDEANTGSLSDLSEQEEKITRGLEALRTSSVRELMTPRVDIVALAAPVHFSDVATAIRKSGHSHFPVYKDELDHLVGTLFAKDLFHLDEFTTSTKDESGQESEIKSHFIPTDLDVTKRLREPYIVPESRAALEVLAEMRRRKRGFAVVVDEYGGLAGVLTIKDLVSELVGDIQDEFDRGKSPQIVKIDASRYLLDGSCTIDEVRSELDMDLPDGEYVTIAGFLLDILGKIPEESDTIHYKDWTFKITKMDRRRIAKIVLQSPGFTLKQD